MFKAIRRQGSIDIYGDPRVSEIRMRERISMKSKMLGALALFTLIGALFVMQSAATSTPRADAATGTIHALNVGTCLATDSEIFEKGIDKGCKLARPGSGDNPVKWEVRKEVEQVSTLYATYAFDPKTASDEPRAILADSDLLKISIADSGRDKRTGVLILGRQRQEIGTDNADGLAFISDTLFEKDVVTESEKSLLGFEPSDTVLTVQGETGAADIPNSGNWTLNFTGATDYRYKPMDIAGTVRFFGCITDQTDCELASTSSDGDDSDNLTDITSSLEVDEDGSQGTVNGDRNTAPWVAVNASVTGGLEVLIYAIYYETSDKEILDGGQAYSSCSGTDEKLEATNSGDEAIPATDPVTTIDTEWKCVKRDSNTGEIVTSAAAVTEIGPEDVVFTSDEIEDNSALVVRAKSDGDEPKVDLYLQETDRFTGRYEGYVRLTDANGIGDADPEMDGNQRDDWGHDVKAGSGHDINRAAVLGVESGPVTIEYRDTDGRKRTLRIEIDRQPPMIQITSPADGTSSDDHTPDFNGSVEDTESGIVGDSFRLVTDNRVDGDGENDDFVLNDFDLWTNVAGTDNANSALVTVDPDAEDGVVTHTGEYYGYGVSADTIGSIMAKMLYDRGRESCGDQDQCHIKADRHDEGATNATFSDSIRLNLRDSRGQAETRDMEYQVDFQAFALDRAGNIGFSDADPTSPRFINDLGVKDANKRNPGNVLGYFSAHIITLDEKDPVAMAEHSATGYYGLSNNALMADRSAVMVVFDGPIAPASVSTNTFAVALDKDNDAVVTDVDVAENYVFLKLQEQLASDAKPMVSIVQGEKVEDNAGNETFSNEFKEIELNDGISPKIEVSLSGGSGAGTGNEGPDKLTRDKITVHVTSDEPLQGSPRVVVVCSNLEWDELSGESRITNDIDDFVANRDGSFMEEPTDNPVPSVPPKTNKEAEGETYEYTCGYDIAPNDQFDDNFEFSDVSTLHRPDEVWEYTWTESGSGSRAFVDGSLTAVAYARDRSRYLMKDETHNNWGSASAEFTLDRDLASPLNGGGQVQPADGGTSKEARPFVLIQFDESTTVTLDSVELDDVEIASDFTEPEDNQFVYWPLSLMRGDHEVEVEAIDAAGNDRVFEFNFTVEERGDFLINLLAGWNAISVPADPIDTAIGAVFTDPAIDTVIGWDIDGWRIAVRRDGVWESNQQYGALNEVRTKYGYWVKSNNFVRQPVALTGNNRGGGPRTPFEIDTKPGWNFVGVIDQDGDQTEGDSGNSLFAGIVPVTASEYLGVSYVRAYTWDATFSRFDVLRPIDTMMIGDGVWVYYDGGIAP